MISQTHANYVRVGWLTLDQIDTVKIAADYTMDETSISVFVWYGNQI